MKFLFPLMIAGMLAAGCASHKPATVGTSVVNPPQPIVTPDSSLTARVASYDSVGRFAVLSFPVGQMPKMDQSLFLYRQGLKVGEVKITGPQNDNNIVADLVDGDAQAGDEVRDQ
jgi:hypothetical protein